MVKWMYKWLPIIFGCHCMDSRSFHIKGKKFPICARCTGELVGIIIGAVMYIFIKPSVFICFLILLPMIIDGFLQSLTKYESNNIKRFVTGLFFGYGFISLIIISTNMAFNFGTEIGRNLKLK